MAPRTPCGGRRRAPRRPVALLVVATTLAAAVVAVQVATDAALDRAPTAAATPLELTNGAVGPLGPISVIGDSVMLGSLLVGPTIGDQLAAAGWGPVRSRAGEGYSTGAFTVKATFKATYWLDLWKQQGWDPKDVVVNLGANDSGFCHASVACSKDAILHLVDAIGPGHRIWWPKITRFYTYSDQANAWNAALDEVAAERANVFVWDWPAEMRAGGYTSPDMTHLTGTGYRQRSAVMAREITADLARGSRTGTDAALPPPIGGAAGFVPLTPKRVLDTRETHAAPLPAGGVAKVDLTSAVPVGTTAVAVGLTSDGSTAPGYLTAYPCGRSRGSVSNVNHGAGVARGAMAVVPIPASGELCVYTRSAGHVIVDLQGAFVPGIGSGFTPSEPARRLVDTRASGRATTLVVDAPAGASAVAVNLTATNVSAPGWLKAYPCGASVPDVSNVNYFPGETVASLAFVPVSAAGTICVRTRVPVDVVVDITGTFRSGAGLRFVPATPTRVLDTRSGLGGWSPIHGQGQTFDTRVVPAGAEAVTGTITLIAPLRPGWLKVYGCGAAPPTTAVNAVAGAVMANAATVGVSSTGRICIDALATGNTLFDVTGWWVP